MSHEAKDEVRSIMLSFYRFAGVPEWRGEMNEEVAAIFGVMLNETQKCSKALGWIPRPPGGKATIVWLATQLGMGVFNATRHRLSPVCAKAAILKWKSALDVAGAGIAARRNTRWV
jgi:hypothetical protein